MKKDYTIAVAGTGYVGLSIATLLSQHHKVMAVDIVKEKVDLINNRKSPIQDDYIQFYETDKRLGLVNKQNLLLSEQNIIDIPCFPDTGGTGEKVKVALQLNVPEKQMYGKSVRYAMTPVEIEIQDTLSKKWRIGLTVACVAGIFLASLINSFDFSKVLEIVNAANCQNRFVKIIFEFLKAKSFWSSTIAAVSTWGMVKLVGRAEL